MGLQFGANGQLARLKS